MKTTSVENDHRHHTVHIKKMLNDLVHHVREDVAKVREPIAQALFETTAEVLRSLREATNSVAIM